MYDDYWPKTLPKIYKKLGEKFAKMQAEDETAADDAANASPKKRKAGSPTRYATSPGKGKSRTRRRPPQRINKSAHP